MNTKTPSSKTKTSTLNGLALKRTLLADERNTLAYIRTGFASFALGIGMINLLEKGNYFIFMGWMIFISGVIFITLGLICLIIRNKKIKSSIEEPV